jgi:hypothetical protein
MQLQNAIRGSRHLIVMWSDNADKSEWVKMEMAYFERERVADSKRLHVHVNLEGRSKVFSKRESIDDLDKTGAYSSGIANLDARLWRQVVDKIDDAISQGGAIPVYRVILASTHNVLTEIPLDKRIFGGPTYGETLEAIGIREKGASAAGWKDKLKSYYGPTRSDWKPFAGATSIDQILANLQVTILANPKFPRFRWRSAADDFWSPDPAVVRAEADRLAMQWECCVIALDPLSLYDDEVLTKLVMLRSRLNDRCGVFVLAPFPIPPAGAHFRRLMQDSAEDLYNKFYRLSHDRELLRGQVNLCQDDLDIRRVVVTIIPLTESVHPVHPALKA